MKIKTQLGEIDLMSHSSAYEKHDKKEEIAENDKVPEINLEKEELILN